MSRIEWRIIIVTAVILTLGITFFLFGNMGDARGCLVYFPTIALVWVLYILFFKNRLNQYSKPVALLILVVFAVMIGLFGQTNRSGSGGPGMSSKEYERANVSRYVAAASAYLNSEEVKQLVKKGDTSLYESETRSKLDRFRSRNDVSDQLIDKYRNDSDMKDRIKQIQDIMDEQLKEVEKNARR